MTTLDTRAKVFAVLFLVAILLCILWINYGYGPGISVVIWADSYGYARSATSLLGAEEYVRSRGRSIGYPLALAAMWAFSKSAMAVVASQFAMVVSASLALFFHLKPRFEKTFSKLGKPLFWARWTLALGIVLSLTHGALHILVQAIMPEILFAALALAALLAAAKFLVIEKATAWLPLQFVATAGLCFANILVKPHWYFVAVFLAIVLAAKLSTLLSQKAGGPRHSWKTVIAAALLSGAALAAFAWPEYQLGKTHSPQEQMHYGPKTVFCNHAHLIDDAFRKNPSALLHQDPSFDTDIRTFFQEWRTGRIGPWKLLGFNGDACTYDDAFAARVQAQFASLEDESGFYVRTVTRAFLMDPLPFVWKALSQTAYGFVFAFQKSKSAMGNYEKVLQTLQSAKELPPDFATGFRTTGRAGLFGGAERESLPLWAQAIRLLVAAISAALSISLIAVIAGLIALALKSYRAWKPETRQNFLVYAVLPFGMLLAHHALVAVVHTFDIWRYSINMYFVSVALLLGGGAFLAERYYESRNSQAR